MFAPLFSGIAHFRKGHRTASRQLSRQMIVTQSRAAIDRPNRMSGEVK
jgi:hypothetical protein